MKGALKSLSERGEVLISGNVIISKHSLEKFVEPACKLIEGDHQKRPWAGGIEPGILGKKLKIGPERLPEVVDYLVSSGRLVIESGLLKHPEHRAELKPDQKDLQGKLNARLSASPLSAPIRKEFIDEDPRYEIVINFLRDRGDIVELKGGILFTGRDFETIVGKVVEYLKQVKQAKASDIKSHLDTSRKYVIPLLEKLDHMGITVRNGDNRTLASK